ncbi:MFS transporter [Pseudomonas mangiferae]|uniref:Aromatic acid/H+ symport family MFS transporter n=1 Tax=Pseudomonas mangiferae TaxID=2593654 RepID=A0A553H4E9_9PSED|nr:aromatic acid/H+ symport family MFS transporter [Pseudomonas mangiferae]TRX76608.1 aromatic acid/H+ symport family MFS transporter [Pseudomonas mangiferae]
MESQIANFHAALDKRPVSGQQWLMLLLLVFLLVTDGYDAQVISYVVPVLVQEWNMPAAAFGPVFSANLFGLTLGALLVSPLGDRIGIRRVLLACVALYACLTVSMVLATNIEVLMAMRFVCGLGMGAAMPSTMALMAEYSPPRLRTVMVTMAACGYSLGGVLGGFIAAAVMDTHGWQAVFVAGGITPLLLLPFLFKYLPDSLSHLFADAPPYARLLKITRRFMPDWEVPPPAPANPQAKVPSSSLPVVNLFRNGWARPTLFIWGTFLASLVLTYFYLSWLPVLLKQSGMSLNAANITTSLFLLSGVTGAVIMSYLADKLQNKTRVLAIMLAGAAVATICIGRSQGHADLLVAFVLLAGFCIIGGQLMLNSFTSSFYPSYARATGIGWAMGIGRFGSIMAPMLGSLLLSLNTPTEQIFYLFVVPAVVAMVLIIQVRKPRDEPPAQPPVPTREPLGSR